MTGGPQGAAWLVGAGCIEIGPSVLLAGGSGWQATFDIRDLPADRLTGFLGGGPYRLILVHGDDAAGGALDIEAPPMNLFP